MVNEMIVRCDYGSDGCEASVQRQLLQTHIREDCQFSRTPCPDSNCNEFVPRHATTSGCAHANSITDDEEVHYFIINIIRCSQCTQMPIASGSMTCTVCKIRFPSHDSFQTHSNDCIVCPFMKYGCSWSGSAESIVDDHLTACPYHALRLFFPVHDARAAKLEEENWTLRARLESSEGILNALVGEINAIKVALGPYLPQSTLSAASERSADAMLPYTQSLPRPISPPVVASSSQTTSDISGYFPPVDSTDVVAESGATAFGEFDNESTDLTRPRNLQHQTTISQQIPLHSQLSSLGITINSIQGGARRTQA